MNEVVDFTTERYRRFAREFVDRYEKFGPDVAGTYALETVKREEFIKVEPFVTEEFLNRGYKFSGTIDE